MNGPANALAPPPSATPLLATPLVALVVPLSGRQQALGKAVRDGFIAAQLAAPSGRRFNAVFIDEASVSAAEAHRQALEAGARVLVGPLLKESVEALAPLARQMAGPLPGQIPVLALNNLADADPGSGGFWQFGLAPEDEAREIASRALALGQRRALVLIPATEWGQRLLAAFTAEFTMGGGVVVDTRTYLPGGSDLATPIRGLLRTRNIAAVAGNPATNPGQKAGFSPGRRDDADLILLGANSSNGRQLVPQLKFFGGVDFPTYSTSAIWDDGGEGADDLDGVIFPDCPWVIDPDGRAQLVRSGIVKYWGRAALGLTRLYALGYDAYQLLPVVLRQPIPAAFGAGEVTGATGTLYADSAGRIHRRLPFAVIRGGRAVPLPAAGPNPGT
ncbi:MAG: penicillin-binding protein activator [Gammaproteobacteria bacterium]